MKKLYVTGGTGFLGSHFIYRHLLTGEFDVTCLVRGATTMSADIVSAMRCSRRASIILPLTRDSLLPA
ncbi:SDR family oxidoreductase [Pseudomonas synxantha]|nr:SDR family oxidoreductase [Pseudomonas synxantha]